MSTAQRAWRAVFFIPALCAKGEIMLKTHYVSEKTMKTDK